MVNQLFQKKKMGLSYLIWLQKSNRYLLLEEPAWFVFNRVYKNYQTASIASACVKRYGHPIEHCVTFVKEIQSTIKQLNLPMYSNTQNEELIVLLNGHQFSPAACHCYCFGNVRIQFSYESELLESYLHPLISHLETSETSIDLPLFELFAFNDQIVFRLNCQVKGIWGYDESHLAKGLIFMNLVNVMYNKTERSWLMTVHASAITNGHNTILLSAGPGGGKTTMAALLQNQGYRLVSDDFVPIDKQTLSTWPFPIAMSIKQGAVNVLSSIYPDLEQSPVNYITSEKSVRYIFHENTCQASQKAFPVKAFVFIHYDPSADFKWEKLDKASSVKQLLAQSWISPTEGTAKILLDQLSRWSFYMLTYSNNQKALDAITQLFGHD